MHGARLPRPATGCVFCLLATLVAACGVPVAGDLDDLEANRVFVALDHANVDATKEPDPAFEGKWRITVARDDVAHALSVMREDKLPRQEPPGVLEALGKESLVPSEAAEQAQLIAGIAGELERSLDGIDGVLRARVHLSIPASGAVRAAGTGRGTASVLVEHRGATPPLSADAVQRLVAGGVDGLLPTDVSVVMVGRPVAPDYGAGDVAHVGPIAVARASLHRLQAALAALVGLVAALAAATLVLYSRLSRAREALAREPSLGPHST
jgi:type III secretion protein J